MAKISLSPITNAQSLSLINDNFDKIADTLNDEVLFRDNPVGEPNSMNQALDMDGNDILNAGTTFTNVLRINGVLVEPTDLAIADALKSQNNLSDVADVAASRVNLGLGNVNNTSDANKPISTATQTALNLKVNKSGDVMSGNLGFNYSPVTSTIGVLWQSAGVARWTASNDGATESGSNTGSNFAINRFNDAGAFIDTPLIVHRDSGSLEPVIELGFRVASGQVKRISWSSTANLTRWRWQTDGAAESGSNVGTNLVLSAHNDAGTFLFSPLTIIRATGAVNLSGPLAVAGTITPTQVAGIVGTTTNNNAQAGSWGEYQTNNTSTTSMTTGTPVAATTLVNLPAGDWDVEGQVTFTPAGTTTVSTLVYGLNSSVAVSTGPNGLFSQEVYQSATVLGTGQQQLRKTGAVRFSLSAPTTISLVAQSNFGVSTMTCNGFIRARRVR